MFKTIQPRILSFDIEWIPDPMAAEILHGVEFNPPYSYPDAFNTMWAAAGATEENPRPWVKTILSRIVSIAAVYREADKNGDNVSLKLVSLPTDPSDPEKSSERAMLDGFLRGIGRQKPQLVGYNSANADVPILVQRAIVNGIDSHGFGARPDKPWEGIDYFSTSSDFHVDLQKCFLGSFRDTPRLHEAATLCGIPGKVDVSGDQVWNLYTTGRLKQIVDYNEFDALTTHLLWARMARFGGLLSADAYEREQQLVRELIVREINEGGKAHLERYLVEWDRLQRIVGKY